WSVTGVQTCALPISCGYPARADGNRPSLTIRFEPMSMRGLFRAVSADRHGAPPPLMASRVVGEQQRATDSFAGFHVREILSAHELRKRLCDRKQQRLGRTP